MPFLIPKRRRRPYPEFPWLSLPCGHEIRVEATDSNISGYTESFQATLEPVRGAAAGRQAVCPLNRVFRRASHGVRGQCACRRRQSQRGSSRSRSGRASGREGHTDVIAVMEANHPRLTTQKSFCVEISRARHRTELVADDVKALRERLETTTGERVSALEGIGAGAERPTAREKAGNRGRQETPRPEDKTRDQRRSRNGSVTISGYAAPSRRASEVRRSAGKPERPQRCGTFGRGDSADDGGESRNLFPNVQ